MMKYLGVTGNWVPTGFGDQALSMCVRVASPRLILYRGVTGNWYPPRFGIQKPKGLCAFESRRPYKFLVEEQSYFEFWSYFILYSGVTGIACGYLTNRLR